MKKFIKNFLKWTGITLLVLIILAILVPIIFKDQLKELVIKEVNKELTATLKLDDFDLTFISTFPNVTLKLYGASLTGTGDFDGIKLADLKEVEAHVALWDVISGDEIEVDEIHIYDPTFDVRFLQDGKANYDIVKPDSLKTEEELEEPSSFKLSLQEYSIKNAKLKYDDRAYNMYLEIDSLNHTGKGDLTADVIDFETVTDMQKISYTMDGIDYLTEVRTDATVNLLMEFKDNSSKYTLKENKIKLNEVDLSVDGFYEMLEDHDEMELKLDASKATFKEFLSLIPAFYHSGYENMIASGALKINGEVKGRYDETNLPGWDFGLNVKNASINYPDLPGKITNIQVDAGSTFGGGGNMDDMKIDVNKFHANLGPNTIDANLAMKNPITDPYLSSKILAKLDLASIKNYIPMGEEKYTGKLDANIDIKGRMSALEAGDYEKFKAEGTAKLTDMVYASPSLHDEVKIQLMNMGFSPEYLRLDSFNGTVGRSDFGMKGNIDNYMSYLFKDELLKGNFDFTSNFIDADHLMSSYYAEEEPAPTKSAKEQASAKDFGGTQPVLVPGNIDFKLNTSINKLRYNGLDFDKINGGMIIKDEVASLENMRMNAMGGTVEAHGSYDTKDHSKPKMDVGYNLTDIDINTLATNFITIEKLAPITKYAQGKISSNLDLQSDLEGDFTPILSSLTSVGDIASKAISIKDVKLLEKIEAKTKLNNLSDQTLKNFKTKFSVDHGKVAVLPFDLALGKINTNVSGYTTLDKKMNYNFKMNVPKEMIPASMIKEVEKAMGQLNALAPNLNIAKLPAKIPVNVNASGDVANPVITTDFKEAILKATGNFKDNLIESVTETVKDTVRAIVDDKVEDIKEEIEKQKQQILDQAQKQADQVKKEAKTAADKIRSEADKQAEELIKAAGSNPLKKKAAEISAKKIRDEANEKAQKLEDEADKKADDIMKKAQERADKLG
jgi:hypothetical protein